MSDLLGWVAGYGTIGVSIALIVVCVVDYIKKPREERKSEKGEVTE